MKLPRFLILAFIIAAIHIVVIALVMNGGCSSSHLSSSGKQVWKADPLPPAPVIPGKKEKMGKKPADFRSNSRDFSGVKPVVPADYSRKVSPPEKGKKRPPVNGSSSAGKAVPSGRSLPAVPGRENEGVRDPRTLSAPSAPRRFSRSAYRTNYAVSGNISRIPLTEKASCGILLDAASRNVLWMKNPDKVVPIASLTKIMTLLLACEDIASGRVTLKDRIKATPGAWRLREGVVWMAPNEIFTLEELMTATSVKSANDAAYLIGEYLGNGNIRNFIARMNARAAALGMRKTKFYNPHGLPGRTKTPDNVSTVKDLLLLSEYVSRIPLFMYFSSIRTAGFRKEGARGHLKLVNHNRLLPKNAYGTNGVDGLKTGYTGKAGFCLSLSCVRNGRRLFAIGMGFKTSAERDKCMKTLVEWGYLRAADPAASPEKIVLPGQKEKRKTASGVRRKKRRT